MGMHGHAMGMVGGRYGINYYRSRLVLVLLALSLSLS